MAFNSKWLEFLREQFPQGSKIKIRELKEGPPRAANVPLGTLERIDRAGVFHVRLGGGSSLGLVLGEDRFSVLPPEPVTLKLYMPLTADLHLRNRYGNLEEAGTKLAGRDLVDFAESITIEMLKNRRPEEAERGLMHWYREEDSVNRKVRFAEFALELNDGWLWGVAECRVTGALTPEELEILKQYISEQASIGWGSRFEQQSIPAADGGEIHVHLWNSSGSWSIQTEQELFDPKPAQAAEMTQQL